MIDSADIFQVYTLAVVLSYIWKVCFGPVQPSFVVIVQ